MDFVIWTCGVYIGPLGTLLIWICSHAACCVGNNNAETVSCYWYMPGGGRGHLYFRLDIILVKGLSKHTLNTHFSHVKIHPKFPFLHVFFLNCPSCPFQNLSIWPKIHLFPILHVFAPLNDVHAYIAWSWKNNPNYMNFLMRMISNFKYKCPSPRVLCVYSLLFSNVVACIYIATA